MEALVLAAGKGTRMRSARPKVLHEIFERPVLEHGLRTLAALGIRRPKIVIGSGAREVRSFIEKKKKAIGIDPVFVLQREQRGTGHAVMIARKALRQAKGGILILPGDMPLLKRSTLEDFLRHHREAKAEVSVLSSLPVDPAGYGRILRAGGRFYAIREEPDAAEDEKRIREVNTGVYLFKASLLFRALRRIKPAKQTKEFYLTDTIEVLSRESRRLEAFPLAPADEGKGINSRAQLAEAVRVMKNREILEHQEKGVTFLAPEQTFVAPDVKIGQDTVIYPWCCIESGVKIGRGCRIGPFAIIRRGSKIGDDAVIGSFVEINRSEIGNKVFAKHLAYLGDAVVGEGTNIGAGTMTANFDGRRKRRTRIGRNVLVGCDTVFVAPVEIRDNARTGAGAVITSGSVIRKGETVVGVPARRLLKKKGREVRGRVQEKNA